MRTEERQHRCEMAGEVAVSATKLWPIQKHTAKHKLAEVDSVHVSLLLVLMLQHFWYVLLVAETVLLGVPLGNSHTCCKLVSVKFPTLAT